MLPLASQTDAPAQWRCALSALSVTSCSSAVWSRCFPRPCVFASKFASTQNRANTRKRSRRVEAATTVNSSPIPPAEDTHPNAELEGGLSSAVARASAALTAYCQVVMPHTVVRCQRCTNHRHGVAPSRCESQGTA